MRFRSSSAISRTAFPSLGTGTRTKISVFGFLMKHFIGIAALPYCMRKQAFWKYPLVADGGCEADMYVSRRLAEAGRTFEQISCEPSLEEINMHAVPFGAGIDELA